MKKNLIELLEKQIVIGDGAMGTMLYASGVFLNRCFDELNLTNPDLVRSIHEKYVQAGVDFIETNTFGATSIKLAKFGLQDKVDAINHAAVKIAREAAEDKVLVAGAIGPLGQELPPYGLFSEKEATEVFLQQAKALSEAGVDFFILETFTNIEELLLASEALHKANPDIPVIAQFTVDENQETVYGIKTEDAVRKIDKSPNVTVIGINCTIGPSTMLRSLEIVLSLTDKPVSVMPNAGLPREVDGRKLYMCTPEYMAEYAKRFSEKGAKIIGGCCGTTPEHIKEIVKTVLPLDKATRPVKAKMRAVAKKLSEEKKLLPAVPLSEKSEIGKKLVEKKTITFVELTPPRGFDLTEMLEKAKLCADNGIDAINIPDGPRASSRLSPMIAAVKIQQTLGIETVLHICCRDRNLIGMQSDILGSYAMGLRNLLLITGDPPKLGDFPDATAVFDIDSIGLTAVVENLNRGIDIAGNAFSDPLGLTIAVGANPVAFDLQREIDRFKLKVDAGAEYAVTQPVFDPKMLKTFLDEVSSHKVPIIAGIWPFMSYKNAEFMANEVPGVVVPDRLLQRMSKTKNREEGKKMGIQIAREMVEEIKTYVDGFAVSAPFGNVKIALAVMNKINPEDV